MFCKRCKIKKSTIFESAFLEIKAFQWLQLIYIFNKKNDKTLQSQTLSQIHFSPITELSQIRNNSHPPETILASTGIWTPVPSLRSSLSYPLGRWLLTLEGQKKNIFKAKSHFLICRKHNPRSTIRKVFKLNN